MSKELWFNHEISKEWKLTRLKNVVISVKNGIWGDEPANTLNDIECVRIADFDRRKNLVKNKKLTVRNIPSNQVESFLLKKGDLLIEKSGGGEKQPVGFVVQYTLDRKAVYANFMAKIELDNQKVDSTFMNYIFTTLYTVKANLKAFNQTTGIQNLNTSTYLNEMFAYPPLKLQKRIVKFLNIKTDAIDNLIDSKEKMIKILEQQRQSIITETVTKGLNPNVKMKDSGVEGIGKIPEHWDLKRLKYALILNPSKNEVSSIKNINVTFLPMENILAPNEVDISIKKKIEEVYNGYTYFKNNDLVLAKVTPCFENGNIAVMENMENGIGFGTTELHVLRPRTKQNISFYYYLAQSGPFKQQGVSTMYGVGGLKRIPNEFVLNYEFGMPPLAEQNEIVDFLNCKCREIQNAKHSIKLQIEKLKEYRQSLIYEAVTGKIDVSDMEID